jgi:hypothetical protein
MGNQVSSLPRDVDSLLEDIAQMFGGIDYSDIIDFSNTATTEQINQIRINADELAQFDFDMEDDEAVIYFDNIVNIVKGETVC